MKEKTVASIQRFRVCFGYWVQATGYSFYISRFTSALSYLFP